MEPFHNARIKYYPDGSSEILIGSRPFGGGSVDNTFLRDASDSAFLSQADESLRREQAYATLERAAIEQGEDVQPVDRDVKPHGLSQSVRRARKAVRDLARSNEWAYFVTLTLSPERCNRYDPVEVLRHLRHWLGNAVRRKGLAYVLVPEHHKDGAIHFHGLFNDALAAVDSGTVSVPGRKAPVKVRSDAHRAALLERGGHTVYNLPDWGWGFSTAIQLYGEREAAISYVCKYIGKEMEKGRPEKIGGRWYYSGGSLQRPSVVWADVDVRDFENMPGWFAPEGGRFGSFLCLRVDSGGVVLPPYSKSAVDSPDAGDGVSRETFVPDRPDAKRGSVQECPVGTSDCTRLESTCPAVQSPAQLLARPASPGFAHPPDSLPCNSFPAHILDNSTHFTFSGLSHEPQTTVLQASCEMEVENGYGFFRPRRCVDDY